MIYFEKSPTAPECLEKEKLKEEKKRNGERKTGGNYKCGCVQEKLQEDFKGKCYICESKFFTSPVVEHFKPHRDIDIGLKFNWENLFLACGYCNGVKSDKFDNILNCTVEEQIENQLEQNYIGFPRYEVDIKAKSDDDKVVNTKDLLLAVFCGRTIKEKLSTTNLRKQLDDEMKKYQSCIEAYYEAHDSEHKNNCLLEIKSHLHSASPFTAFKRQIIRSYHPKLFAKFGSSF